MSQFSQIFLVTLCVLASAYPAIQTSPKASPEQQPKASSIREEPPKAVAGTAPAAAIRLVREFIAYVFQKTPDIGTDKVGQQRWLSQNLQKGLAHRQELYREYIKKYPDSPAQPPGNGSFMGAWDNPTSYSILGSRRYADRAVVDIEFRWGENTQYPGDRRLASYILVDETGWKLEDIYTFQGKFTAGAHSLSADFQSDTFP